jgi:hypothetical protein
MSNDKKDDIDKKKEDNNIFELAECGNIEVKRHNGFLRIRWERNGKQELITSIFDVFPRRPTRTLDSLIQALRSLRIDKKSLDEIQRLAVDMMSTWLEKTS